MIMKAENIYIKSKKNEETIIIIIVIFFQERNIGIVQKGSGDKIWT